MSKIMGWLACAGAMLLLVGALVSGSLGVAADAATTSGAPKASAAWIRLAAVPGRPAAGYLVLNAGARPLELVGVASPLARIEMHSSSMAGGVMRMDRLPAVRVPARGEQRFAPGAAHLMLYDLPATVKPGATVPLVLRFADGTTIKVDAVAQAAGAEAPMDHGAH